VILPDVLGYFDALVAHGAMTYAKLVDAREAEPSLSELDMAIVGDAVRALGLFDPRGPIAVVAGTPEMMDFLHRFKIVDHAPRPIENFSTLEGAKAWLASCSK
jgi:hypothetical protein